MSTYYMDYKNGNDANGGTSWVDAKRSMSGFSAAMLNPTDVIRIAKSDDPVSIGNATWTNLSKTISIASPLSVAVVDNCETAWTANPSGDTTVARTAVATEGKEGSYSMKLTLDSSPQTSTMQAYSATGTLDLSSYQKLTFWIKNSAAITANQWTVTLCSDVAGATPVDTFAIPAIGSTGRSVALTLIRNGGGNFGSSIKSIAVNTGSSAPTASSNIYVDNFIATTTNGICLTSLISKNSNAQGGTDEWCPIQSINPSTILLDTGTNTKANAGRGYSGSTATVTTYFRNCIETDIAATSSTKVQEILDSGTFGNEIQFQGGYNTTSGLQDGETFFNGRNSYGIGLEITGKGYIKLNFINFFSYNSAVYLGSGTNNIEFTNLNFLGNNGDHCFYINSGSNNVIKNGVGYVFSPDGVYMLDGFNNEVEKVYHCSSNNNYGLYFNGAAYNKLCCENAKNNGSYGVRFTGSSENTITCIDTSDNGTAAVYADKGTNYFRKANFGEATVVSGQTSYANSIISSYAEDGDIDNNIIYSDGATATMIDTDRAGATGFMWKIAIISASRNLNYPMRIPISSFEVVANKAITFKAYVKKDHATDVVGSLVIRGGQLAGIDTDVKTDFSTADTNWHELTLTTTATPTEKGTIEVEFWGYYSAGNSNVYLGDITEISQAD